MYLGIAKNKAILKISAYYVPDWTVVWLKYTGHEVWEKYHIMFKDAQSAWVTISAICI